MRFVKVLKISPITFQEPLNSCHPSDTKDDFWLMVWQQNCSVIIMLNDPRENNSFSNRGLYPYYPTGTQNYDVFTGNNPDITVKLVSKEVKSGYINSTLDLCVGSGGPARRVTHLQFCGWSDYGTPKSPSGFLKFLKKCREVYSSEDREAPPVVHCSAGTENGEFCNSNMSSFLQYHLAFRTSASYNRLSG